MKLNDVEQRADLELIIKEFYDRILVDPIIGFIFVDVVKIDLASHLPLIVNFWFDVIFNNNSLDKKNKAANLYHGNVLQKHLEIHSLVTLKSGHFTRWLYLFNIVIDANYSGRNSELMKDRAELIAKSISAAISDQKKSSMNLVLPKTRKSK